MTSLQRTSTGHAGNIDQFANTPEKAESRSSVASSRRFRLPRAWASKANFANGEIYCESEIDHGNASNPVSSGRTTPDGAAPNWQSGLLAITVCTQLCSMPAGACRLNQKGLTPPSSGRPLMSNVSWFSSHPKRAATDARRRLRLSA